ncbi:response regulator [Marinibaculum pumilum]|uniref:Response regulator n=1 Tax=Marinibaculum pumilum TaxID=1766165 RepID=A0ABV7L1G1_9PROT
MAVVLIVDDDALVAETIGMYLESAGHEAVLARHGGEALERLKKYPIDVALTDILMPEVEGFEFLLSARRQGHEVPIIAMTGGSKRHASAGGEYDYLKMARQLGATRSIKKPFTQRQLLDEVEACLNEQMNKEENI